MKNNYIKKSIVSLLSPSIIERIKIFEGNLKAHFTKKQSIGKNSYVDSSVHVLGWGNVKIGENSVISQDTWININHREKGNISVIIGDNCFIGKRNFFSSGALIKIGDYCLTGIDCRFLGSDHIFTSPFVPYIATGTTKEGVIEIGTNCWLTTGITILKGVKVGYGSIIGAATVINQDIPPLSVVVGNPCKIIRRFDMQSETWVKTQDYPEDSDRYLPSEAEYLEILQKTYPKNKGPLLASSKSFGDV